MKYTSCLIKPASSMCNLKCKYCFYKDESENRTISNYGLMNFETSKAIIKKMLNQFDEESDITFIFQGGEPTLADLDYFKQFINEVNTQNKKYHTVHYHLQTNGVLINNDWIDFLKENDFLIGISFDGYPENNDINRIDNSNVPTSDKVIATIKLLQKNNIPFNILCVLTEDLSYEANKCFTWLVDNNISYVQFIPCLSNEDESMSEYSLTPKGFFRFYDEMYKLWTSKQNNLRIDFFENIIKLTNGLIPSQCGFLGFCTMQNVFEGNGNTYSCDFYCTDQYLLGNINDDSLQKLQDESSSKFINRIIKEDNICKKCEWFNICHGQCPRFKKNTRNDRYCGYKEFLDKYIKQ